VIRSATNLTSPPGLWHMRRRDFVDRREVIIALLTHLTSSAPPTSLYTRCSQR
jgi:hypothetical protein